MFVNQSLRGEGWDFSISEKKKVFLKEITCNKRWQDRSPEGRRTDKEEGRRQCKILNTSGRRLLLTTCITWNKLLFLFVHWFY